MPPSSPVRHPFLDGPYPRAMAHRGWHIGNLAGMENTLSAFVRAVDEGYAYVETDAHTSADGVVVLHHDLGLARTTGGAGHLATLSAAELSGLLVAGREPVPTLAEVLLALPRTRFNIDVKADSTVRPLLTVLSDTDSWDRVCVAAFSEPRLRQLRRLAGPRLLTSLGPTSVAALRVRALLPVGMPTTGLPVGDVAQVPVGAWGLRVVDRRFVGEVHHGSREVHMWTVNEAALMHGLLDRGVDGVITDAPDVLREVLESRGQWRPRG